MNGLFHPSTLRRAKSAAALLASSIEGERQAAWTAFDRLTGGNPAALLVPAIEALEQSPVASFRPATPGNRDLTETDLHDSWQQSAMLMAASSLPLSAWERRFLKDMVNDRRPPTQGQADRLAGIAATFNKWRMAHG